MLKKVLKIEVDDLNNMNNKILNTLLTILLIFYFLACNNSTSPYIDNPDSSNSSLFVIEKDNILGNRNYTDMFHETFIINTSQDTINLNVKSPTPQGLTRESALSPAFGRDALIPIDYTKYFDVPNIANISLTNEPDLSTEESHFWKNIKLGPSDGIQVPYSNYMGKAEELFIKEFGTCSALNLDIISDYSIERNPNNSSYIDIEIKETKLNTSNDTIYNIGILLHVPRELKINSEWEKLYNLVSDSVITTSIFHLYHKSGLVDGFGNRSSGHWIWTQKDTLLPNHSFDFLYKMTIEPLMDKFEIYPFHQIRTESKGERIWPASIITFDNKIYTGPVDYLRVCGLALPTYILFSIDKDNLRVVSPDDIEPTFTP